MVFPMGLGLFGAQVPAHWAQVAAYQGTVKTNKIHKFTNKSKEVCIFPIIACACRRDLCLTLVLSLHGVYMYI